MIFSLPLKFYLQLSQSRKSVFLFCPAARGLSQVVCHCTPSLLILLLTAWYLGIVMPGFAHAQSMPDLLDRSTGVATSPHQLPAFLSDEHRPLVPQMPERQHVSLLSAPSDGLCVTQMEKARILSLLTRLPDQALPCGLMGHTAHPSPWAHCSHAGHLAVSQARQALTPASGLCCPSLCQKRSFPAPVLCGFLPHLLQVHTEMSLSAEGFPGYCLK